VRRLAPTSFAELVDQVLNCAVSLNITRAHYATLPKESRQKAKRVPYVVPCGFSSSPSQRLVELAQTISLVCLDIDDPQLAAPYFSSPATLAEQLMEFNFALHTTASSTPTAPRLRLLVEAQELTPDRYRDAVLEVARRIGLTKVTKESFTVHQPMYLPTLFKGETSHPLLWSETGARAFTQDDIGDTDDEQPEPNPFEPTGNFDTTATGDDLDYLRPTVEGVTIQDAAAALTHIDPDCVYNEWLEIAAALRHQFPLEPLASKAFALFDSWSSKGTKYVGEEDTEAKWKSLRPNPRGRVPVTIRTLMTRAAQGGWDSSLVKQRCYKNTQLWISSYRGEDGSKLITEGLGRIAATPLLSQSEEDALLSEIITAARRIGMKITASSLRKDLKKLKSATQAEKKKKEKMPDWAKGLCYVAAINKFIRPQTGEHFSPEALDRAFAHKLLPSDEQLRSLASQSIGTMGTPVISPQDYLLNIIQVPTAYDLIYDPAQPNDTFVHRHGKVFLNTYQRSHPEPDPDTAFEAGNLLLEHLINLIAEPAYRITILDFMAYLVQHPGSKIRWAILLQGAEGCGKTFLAEAMKAVLGDEHVRMVGDQALRGTWNDWAYGAQLTALEEVRVAGHNRYEVMNALKPLITNDVISINQRFRDSRNVQNITNYILFTNHHDALALSSGDRRYFVVKSPIQTKAQVVRLNRNNYFDRMHSMLEDNASGLRSFLETYDISPSFPVNGPAPITTYLTQLVNDASSDLSVAVSTALEDAGHPLLRRDFLSGTTLLQSLLQDGYKVTPQHLGSILRDMGYTTMGRSLLSDDVRHTLWVNIDAGLHMTQDSARELANQRLTEDLL
jgi:hypothetical protein